MRSRKDERENIQGIPNHDERIKDLSGNWEVPLRDRLLGESWDLALDSSQNPAVENRGGVEVEVFNRVLDRFLRVKDRLLARNLVPEFFRIRSARYKQRIRDCKRISKRQD